MKQKNSILWGGLNNVIMKLKGRKNYDNSHASLYFLNTNHFSNDNYTIKADEAYSKNVIVYRAINLVASAAASVPWRLHLIKGDKKIEIHQHPLLDLLHRPNPLTAGAAFFQNLYSYKLISGNSFIYALAKDNKLPIELHLLRPDRVTIEPGVGSIPKCYKYKIGERELRFNVDKLTGQSNVLHIKNFNPLNDYYGLSPLAAAAFSVDQHNEASKWNLAMLKNAARPSGALIFKANNSQDFLTNEQYDDLKSQLHEIYCSANNAGKPILLQGGLEWQELSLSPKDMDFIESKHSTARDIALAFGVPPQLLGIPGDSTYSNMQEARLALWEETIIPLLDHTTDALNNWLVPNFNEKLSLYYNIDEISALSERREKLWMRVEQASFLTINEKRKMVGLSPLKEGEKICNSNM